MVIGVFDISELTLVSAVWESRWTANCRLSGIGTSEKDGPAMNAGSSTDPAEITPSFVYTRILPMPCGVILSLSEGTIVNPNPPKDTDGRREDSGRGWVRELQGRWPGVLGVDGRPADGLQSPHRALRPYAGVAMRGMARGYAAGDSRDRGGARLRGRWVSCRLAVRPGTEWLAAGPRRD